MTLPLANDRRLKTAAAAVGALTAVAAVWLGRSRNMCSTTSDGEDICTLMYVHPLPFWFYAVVGMAGGLAGWLLVALALNAVHRLTLGGE